MEIEVYDNLDSSKKTIHFDVLLPSSGKKDDASICQGFPRKNGEASEALDRCKFCHSEKTDAEVEKQLKSDGYYIVSIDGCPKN